MLPFLWLILIVAKNHKLMKTILHLGIVHINQQLFLLQMIVDSLLTKGQNCYILFIEHINSCSERGHIFENLSKQQRTYLQADSSSTP